MCIKKITTVFMLVACVSCGGEGDFGGVSVDPAFLSGMSSSTAINAGNGFVFAISEKFSDKPQGVVAVELVSQGEPVKFEMLTNRAVFFPYHHMSGNVTVTESCFGGSGGAIQYRRIAALTPTGETSPLTPCSEHIPSPSGFTWIKEGKLSPNGQLLAATLTSTSEPPISVVYENGQEIVRYNGYANPEWIDDNSLVLVGVKLLTVRLGEEPVVLTEAVSGTSIGRVDVSPDGSRMAFEWGTELWLINTDGTGLRQLLPAGYYTFPAWSPDGRWVAALTRQAPSNLDAQLVGIGAIGVPFVYTNIQAISFVNADTGEQQYADVSMLMNDSQMPQGGLSWY